MEIIVRHYEEKDLEKVNELLKESFSVTKQNVSSSMVREIVAEADGVVCGYMVLTKVFNPVLNQNYYLVDYVCVSSFYRRQGIGKSMLFYAEGLAREEKGMYLQLTSARFREAAHKLYLGQGFVKRETDVFRKDLL